MSDMDRSTFIGSSDIAAVCGLSRWTTPLKLWAEKTGLILPDDLSEVEAAEWGTRLEAVVATKFAETHGVKIMAYKKRFVHPDHDFISCELDRIITKTDMLVEVKTCNAFKADEWEDEEYPTEYALQVQLAMGLSKRKKAWMFVLIGGQRYVEKELEFDQELYDMLIERAVEFWGMVQDKTPPVAMAGDGETLATLFPGDPQLDYLVLEDDEATSMECLIHTLQSVKKEIKALGASKDELQNTIKQRMENADTMVAGGCTVTWKSQTARRADPKAMREDNIFQAYSKESVSRVMRVKMPKGR